MTESGDRRRLALATLALLTSIWLALTLIQILGPPTLLDNDQERPAAYILDALLNGNWIIQVDQTGDVASKPPFYTWIAALFALSTGRLTVWELYAPGALGVLLTSWLLLGFGGRHLGPRAAALAAAMWICSLPAFKQLALSRTDPIFTFTTVLAAFLLFRAWNSGRGWFLFWLAAAASTLTKGPLGLGVALGGLAVAAIWERRDGRAGSPAGRWWPGAIAYAVICGGWFVAAYLDLGHALVQKQIGDELVGHAVKSGKGARPFEEFYKPTLYFIARFAPWSIAALVGMTALLARPLGPLARVWTGPSPADDARRFERFLLGYFLVGLAIFSAAPHQRADHLMPLLPAAALIAGRWIAAMWKGGFDARFLVRVVAVPGVLFAIGTAAYNFTQLPRERLTQRAIAVRELADAIDQRYGPGATVLSSGAPFLLQFHRTQMVRRISERAAVEALTGREANLVAVRRDDLDEDVRKLVDSGSVDVVLSSAPVGSYQVLILGNKGVPHPSVGPATSRRRSLEPRWLGLLWSGLLLLIILPLGAMRTANCLVFGRESNNKE